MQKVLARASPFSLRAVVMMRVAALPPAKMGALDRAIWGHMVGIPTRMMTSTAPHTHRKAVTTTRHCCLSSWKSMVVPRDTMSSPAITLPKPVICASPMMVSGSSPLQKPANNRMAILRTEEKMVFVFWAMSSPAA